MAIGPFRESVDVTIDTSAVGPYLESKTNAIREALIARMTAVDTMLQSKIVGKLSGELLQQRTGKLSSSVRIVETTASATEIAGGVTAGGGPVNYAAALEYGAKAHIIQAINVKALAFMWQGRQVFFKSVNHPGNEAYAYMRGTLDENSENIQAEFQDAADEAARS
jgi:hypothetical protein